MYVYVCMYDREPETGRQAGRQAEREESQDVLGGVATVAGAILP